MSHFVGKRVVAVRGMTEDEIAEQPEAWASVKPPPTVLEFDDGSTVFAASDTASSSPAVLMGELPSGDTVILRPKRGKAASRPAAQPSAAPPAAVPAEEGWQQQPWRRQGGLTQLGEAATGAPAGSPGSQWAAHDAGDAALQALRGVVTGYSALALLFEAALTCCSKVLLLPNRCPEALER